MLCTGCIFAAPCHCSCICHDHQSLNHAGAAKEEQSPWLVETGYATIAISPPDITLEPALCTSCPKLLGNTH